MTDFLVLRDLEFPTRIGVTDAERATEQKLLVTVEMPVDSSLVSSEDDINFALDYAIVRQAILGIRGTERHTIERLANDIATLVLHDFHLESVTVTVKKFPFPDAAAVEIRLMRP